MSLYPQTQAFSPSYPVQGYPPPVPPPGYPYPPPPQPIFHVDPNTFRRDYMSRLGELTVNSRPIIQNLSMIAQEYARFAEVVAQCIETHIRRVPPWMKLPAFYLLDAISKNVFDPYARQFTPIVVRLYLDTYEQVDQSTRSKMEEMLLTWRTGAPTGRELFGVVPQLAIERHIWGSESAQNTASTSRLQGGQSISKNQVLSELEFVLGQKERALQANPYDKLSQNHVAVLHQLRKLVQAGVSPDELAQILTQLRTLAPPPVPSVSQAPPPAAAHPYPAQSSFIPPVPAQPSYHTSAAPPPFPVQPSYALPSYDQTKLEPVESFGSISAPPSMSSGPSVSAPAPATNNIASLFSALVKAGVVSASGTPTGAGATAKAEEQPEARAADPTREAVREYRKAILSAKIKLTSVDIMKQRPPIVQFLYSYLPNQCKQCGIRFPDGVTGKKKLEDHLDMHFRQNRKANQTVGRGHSRSWFIGIEDWIHDGISDNKGKGRDDGTRPLNAKAAAAAEAAKRDAELRALHVVVPPGDEAKAIACPICKEPLKSEFLEDDEEWVWRNAVKKDDRIYHATCYAEAAASKSSLAVRLRGEVSSRSRSRTPETQTRSPMKVPIPLAAEAWKSESPPPSTLAGTKRKAEDDGNSIAADEEQPTPPLKKMALSSTSA